MGALPFPRHGHGAPLPLAGDAAIIGKALEALATHARDAGLGELAQSILELGLEAAEIARHTGKLSH